MVCGSCALGQWPTCGGLCMLMSHNLMSPSEEAEKQRRLVSSSVSERTAKGWAVHCSRCLRCRKSKTQISPRWPPLMSVESAAEWTMQEPSSWAAQEATNACEGGSKTSHTHTL
eukprot:CAMPEP_0119348120 /NCGR_PEP_ID=MMETSP1333-20130426/108878_1 /TAXON_ID=418940 /ORGANISM="Scyphosphaera apsteinii, Strain RCC1455" /LENGTH=113 /DNA_ID=CAMNT_0007360689 /DNA_START=363 /DNA_END=704 /DNA_ORIENTATION=-